jgi:hypothetical protein
VFASAFTLGSAIAVAGHADADAIEAMANLVAKSLISADVSGAAVQYRLLDTTRAYALQKLADSGELEELVRRHAEHHRDLFEQAEAEWKARPTAEWLADYGCKIDDVRNALRWAFSAKGDASIGVALTIAAIPLWMHLSLVDECRLFVERALASEMVKPGRCGRKDEIALERSERSCVAELLRIKGKLFRPEESIGAAEDHCRQVPEWSRRSLVVGAAHGHELGPAVAPTRQDQRAE